MNSKNMEFTKYRELALRTIKPHASKELAIADWALGLGGELSEVVELINQQSTDKMEIAKELGDVLWYTVALAKEVDIILPENILQATQEFYSDRSHCETCLLDQHTIPNTLVQLTITIGTIQERMKHAIMHKEAGAANIEGLLHGVIEKLTYLSILQGFTIFDVAELNAAKLAHRYNTKNGGKYTHEASAVRHDAELKFEDTATYKRLLSRITGAAVIITPTDIEVL